ncbi:Choline-sulfatase [Phycisphaerae bacterium RAS1]|nr:Choline-sulfatase [Phycisphaerae bacterium RAS1]
MGIIPPTMPLTVTVAPCRPICGAAFLLLSVIGCGHGGPIRATLKNGVERPQPAVILFIADGLGADMLERGCAEGWLPNIQRRFVQAGLRVENAMTAVPAITYPSIVTLLTGASPARHEIVGNRWFDPRDFRFRNSLTINTYRAVNRDFESPTVYERLAPAPTAGIQCPIRRGVTKNFANWAASGVMWFFRDYTAVDKLTVDSLPRVVLWANSLSRWPSLLTVYFPGLDTVGHVHGPESEKYRWAAWHVDHQVGRVCDWLESQDLLKSSYIVLTSDHGQVEIRSDGRVDLMALLRDAGRSPTDRQIQDGKLEDRRRHFNAFDTVACWRDGRFGIVHFKGAGGWSDPPTFAEVEAVAARFCQGSQRGAAAAPHGIQLVAYLRSQCEAGLIGPDGAARIIERETTAGVEYAYAPQPADVFGYLATPELAGFVAAGFHSSRDWLGATCRAAIPDVVPHLIPLLRCRRAGQMLVICADGYSLSGERGGHGGLLRREMRVPLLIAGPGIAPGSSLEMSRAVDLTPTLLTLLGRQAAIGDDLEGRALPLRSAD